MKDELKYVGNIKQLIDVREVQLLEGKANGSKIIEVNNNSGLYFEVNTDRGFDIPFLRYKGINLGYISPCGISSSKYYDDKEYGFLKNFTVGFLTTCGLKSIGTPSLFKGKNYGLHGDYSNTPCDHYYYRIEEDQDGIFIDLNATVYDGQIFQDKLKLERNIKCYYKSSKIVINDTVTNESFNDAIHNILYHINFGYPLLSPESEIYLNSTEIEPRNLRAKELIDSYAKFDEPESEFEEVCYYHTLKRNKNNQSVTGVYNPELSMGVAIIIDCENLDYLVEWKMMQKRDYVLGLEPASNRIDGLNDLEERGLLKYLKPGESISYKIEVQIIEEYQEFDKIFKV